MEMTLPQTTSAPADALTVFRERMRQSGGAFAALTLGVVGIVGAMLVLVGSVLQIANISIGLMATQVLIMLIPPLAVIRGLGIPYRRFLQLRRVPAAVLGVTVLLVFCNCLVAIGIHLRVRLWFPEGVRELFEPGDLFQVDFIWEQVLLYIGLVAGAGICEEVMFRGYLQRVFHTRWPAWAAIVATGGLFSAIHLDPIGFLARWELGIVFGYLVYRSGSLFVGILSHALHNLTATLTSTHWETGAIDTDAILLWCVPATVILIVIFVRVTGRSPHQDEGGSTDDPGTAETSPQLPPPVAAARPVAIPLGPDASGMAPAIPPAVVPVAYLVPASVEAIAAARQAQRAPLFAAMKQLGVAVAFCVLAALMIFTALLALDHHSLSLNYHLLSNGYPLRELYRAVGAAEDQPLMARLEKADHLTRVAVRRGRISAEGLLKTQNDIARKVEREEAGGTSLRTEKLDDLIARLEAIIPNDGDGG